MQIHPLSLFYQHTKQLFSCPLPKNNKITEIVKRTLFKLPFEVAMLGTNLINLTFKKCCKAPKEIERTEKFFFYKKVFTDNYSKLNDEERKYYLNFCLNLFSLARCSSEYELIESILAKIDPKTIQYDYKVFIDQAILFLEKVYSKKFTEDASFIACKLLMRLNFGFLAIDPKVYENQIKQYACTTIKEAILVHDVSKAFKDKTILENKTQYIAVMVIRVSGLSLKYHKRKTYEELLKYFTIKPDQDKRDALMWFLLGRAHLNVMISDSQLNASDILTFKIPKKVLRIFKEKD